MKEEDLQLFEDAKGEEFSKILDKMYSSTNNKSFKCLVCNGDSYSIAMHGASMPRINLYPGSNYYESLVVVCERCGFSHTFVLSVLKRNFE